MIPWWGKEYVVIIIEMLCMQMPNMNNVMTMVIDNNLLIITSIKKPRKTMGFTFWMTINSIFSHLKVSWGVWGRIEDHQHKKNHVIQLNCCIIHNINLKCDNTWKIRSYHAQMLHGKWLVFWVLRWITPSSHLLFTHKLKIKIVQICVVICFPKKTLHQLFKCNVVL